MVDQALRRELKLTIENDGRLHTTRVVPIRSNLRAKWIAGKYDHTKAPKAWRYLVDDGARQYEREWGVRTDSPTRALIAQDFADEFKDELEISEPIAKKPAAKKKAAKKKAAKKKAKKRSKPKAEDEVRLTKAVGQLVDAYALNYKLTAAQTLLRDASRRGRPIKAKKVVTAYDQFVRAAKTRKKSPRQGAAYYVAAELHKVLRKLPELSSSAKGDHPRLKVV